MFEGLVMLKKSLSGLSVLATSPFRIRVSSA